jgi:hypothetical protein
MPMPTLMDHGLVGAFQPVSILLMADYGADPLWRRYESVQGTRVVNLTLDSLPLSSPLKRELRAWATRFDALSRTDYAWPSRAARQQWVTDGQALLDPVRRELGPGYDVTYSADHY